MCNTSKFTIKDLQERYPNEDACLNKIFDLRFKDLKACPKCAVANPKFYRVKGRKCYECKDCLYQIYPMAGTVFENSTTDLTIWFHIIFLFACSKNGVSAKEIQRQTGVTYKCAWRLGHCVRKLMDEGSIFLEGVVEVDEALIGGRKKGKRGWGAEGKTTLFGMVEKGGKAKIKTVDGRSKEIILPIIISTIVAGSTINSDEYRGYNDLCQLGFEHKKVNHSHYQWKNGDCHTNSIEGFWSNLKKSLLGTHTQVSKKHLQNYLNEFSFRYNNRKGVVIFDEMLNMLSKI